MADNVEANAGSGGAVFATDEIGGVHYTLGKVTFGVLDSVTLVSASDGLPVVSETGATWTVVNAGTFATQVDGDALTALQLIDDCIHATNGALSKTAAIGGHMDDTATVAATEGNVAPVRITAQRGIHANLRNVSGTEIGTASAPVRTDPTGTTTQPVSGTVTADAGTNLNTSALALESGGNLATIAGAVSGTEMQVDIVTGTVTANAGTNLNTSALALESGGNLATLAGAVSGTEVQADIVAALPTGTNTIGNVGLAPRTAGGHSISRVISAATTNATSVKGSAGQVFGWYFSNINAAARYLKLYNKATAPTVGTDTPVLTLAIPGNTAGVAGHVEFANGIEFATGIGLALTTGVADADTGAVAANEIVVNLLYK